MVQLVFDHLIVPDLCRIVPLNQTIVAFLVLVLVLRYVGIFRHDVLHHFHKHRYFFIQRFVCSPSVTTICKPSSGNLVSCSFFFAVVPLRMSVNMVSQQTFQMLHTEIFGGFIYDFIFCSSLLQRMAACLSFRFQPGASSQAAYPYRNALRSPAVSQCRTRQ